MLERGVMLNVDICHKVIRTDNVLTLINDIRQKSRNDPREDIKAALVGSIVMTSYNQRMYKIDDIDFNMSLTDSFDQSKGGGSITYLDYFRTKYGKEIRDSNQPVIVNVH